MIGSPPLTLAFRLPKNWREGPPLGSGGTGAFQRQLSEAAQVAYRFKETGVKAHRSEAVERALQTCGTPMRWRTAFSRSESNVADATRDGRFTVRANRKLNLKQNP